VLIALLLSSIAASPAIQRFEADFPAAHRIASLDGRCLIQAGGFALDTGSRVPEVAARTFLSLHGAAFGVTLRQALELEVAPVMGRSGVVRFRRTVDGLPVFGGNLVVGVDDRARILSVNGTDVPAAISGRRALSVSSAQRVAAGSFPGGAQGTGPMSVTAGWRRSGPTLRAVYRVDFIARKPAGDWRVFVDAETGAILFREDLRRYVSIEGRAYEVSPSQSGTALCPIVGNTHPPCTTPSTVAFPNLTTGTDLTGTQTTVFNCKGGDAPATAAEVTTVCGSPVPAVNNTFDFTPDTTFPDTDVNDDFSAAMAYFHLDKHVSMFRRLDPTLPPVGTAPRALRDSVPALVNVLCGPNLDCTQGVQPFDNAFFSGGLNAMVFGQGSSADFAYDATIAYHEFTHGVIFAWGDFNIDIDALGGLDEPGAVNEGTADTMSSAETERPEIGSFVTSVDADPRFQAPFIRNMSDPAASRTCQGNGGQFGRFFSNDITGLDGEVHDDGEIWNGLTWEVFQGLKAAGFKGCNGACEAEPALQYRTIQLSGGTSPTLQSQWLTLKSAASALFPANPEVANYVDCVGKRRGFDKCDRTFPLYQGDVKSQFIRLRFSTFQFVVNANQAGSSISVCSILGTSATVWARKAQPVEVTLPFDPNTGAATAIVADQGFPITHSCRSTPQTTSFSLPSAGTWYLLIESPSAFPGASPAGADVFGLLPGPGFSTRPASTPPPICDTPSNLSISASGTSIPPRGHSTFTPSAGTGAPYTWLVGINASGASIDAATGAYTAGPIPDVTDIVELNDSAGNIRTKSVSVGAGVTVSPTTTTLARKAKVTFKATGGSGTGFKWSFATNASGGSINASSGQYQAGGTPNVNDVIVAIDSLGNTANANITINNAPPADDGGCSTGGGPDAMALVAGIAAMIKRRRSSRR
jgi:hypothetical protein